jgi:hypothetical protein
MGGELRWPRWAAAALLVGALAGPAAAARVRYHYAPADPCGALPLAPAGPGERLAWFGASARPEPCPPPRANQVLGFRHPYTGRPVRVPVALPEGTPRPVYRAEWAVYDYGSYTVGVHFLPDGSADVVYDSGLFRAP